MNYVVFHIFHLSLITALSTGSNILVLYPSISFSHVVNMDRLSESLANKGHNITVLSFHTKKTYIPNYRIINLSTGDGLEHSSLPIDSSRKTKVYFWSQVVWMKYLAEICWNATENNLQFRNFLLENNTFDVVIIDNLNIDHFWGVAKMFNTPIIGKILDQINLISSHHLSRFKLYKKMLYIYFENWPFMHPTVSFIRQRPVRNEGKFIFGHSVMIFRKFV